MSTRCQVVVKDSYGNELWFYRHSDGYPDGVKKSLSIFLNWLKTDKIRNNVGQAAGWLIILGAIEYQTLPTNCFPEAGKELWEMDNTNIFNAMNFSPVDWQIGAYEPSVSRQHGDIKYLYTIDLAKKEIKVKDIYQKKEQIFLN